MFLRTRTLERQWENKEHTFLFKYDWCKSTNQNTNQILFMFLRTETLDRQWEKKEHTFLFEYDWCKSTNQNTYQIMFMFLRTETLERQWDENQCIFFSNMIGVNQPIKIQIKSCSCF